MKNHLQVLIGILLSLPASGQELDLSSLKGNQQLDSIVIYGTSDQPAIKYAYIYDERGVLLHTFWSLWEWEWAIQTRLDHYYNDKGNPDKDIGLAFKQTSGQWDTLSITFFSYDDNGNMIRELCRAWDNFLHVYKNNMEFDYAYDENNRMTERTNLNWDDATSTWINYEKIIFTYTDAGRDSTRITCHYSYQIEDWYASKKVVYYYDENGNDTLLYEYNVYLNSPELSHKTLQKFDENGFMISGEVYKYQNSSWSPLNKHEYVPDPYGNILTDIHFATWSESEKKWQDTSKIEYYYSGPVVSVNNCPESILIISPNPAGSNITFNLPNDSEIYRVQLYNLKGAKVIDQILANNVLPVGFLPRGVYVFKLVNSHKVFSGKLILQ